MFKLRALGWLFALSLTGCHPSVSLHSTRRALPPLTLSGQNFIQISAGGRHTCALKKEGRVRCWGQNNRGQLGQPPSRLNTTPQLIPQLKGVVQISAGDSHTCALKKEGRVECWGDNNLGQLGRGVALDVAHRPSPVLGLGASQQISAGTTHTCALRRDGTVWCWGDNADGQLGDGSVLSHDTPRRVIALPEPALRVSAGGRHTCALLRSGSAWCWGNNASGQLGDGTQLTRPTPHLVASLHDVVQVAASSHDQTCALRSDGDVFCWGDPAGSAQLDAASSGGSLLPVVAPASAVTQLSTGAQHACTLDDDADVLCWGNNTFGQLGGDLDASAPAAVDDLDDASQISAGDLHTCALTRRDQVLCWGDNAFGQLGLLDVDFVSAPTRVDLLDGAQKRRR